MGSHPMESRNVAQMAKVFWFFFSKKNRFPNMPLYIKLLYLALSTELTTITPMIGILLAVGLVTAIFQSALQIEDATFSLLPKTFAMITIAIFGGFGALKHFEDFAVFFISHAAELVRQTWS